MNQHLQHILDILQQGETSFVEKKDSITQSLKEADKEFEIIAFKLDRTEKVKRTTAILLEETIDELEQKRKAVEAQNRDLEIESSLERVRTVAMSMSKPDDMLDVCKTIALQLQALGVKEIRNVQAAIFYEERGTYMNYEFYAKHDKTIITEPVYTNHDVPKNFAEQMLKGKGEVYITHIKDEEVKDWIAYQKTTNVFIDSFLENATSLNYYWHSLGPVALGISTYNPLSGEELELFQRFLKVFDLSYRRYLDLEKAIAQAREAKIEAALEKVRSRSLAMHTTAELQDVIHTVHKELLNLNMAINGGSFIAINTEVETTLRCWGSGGTADTSEEVDIPLYEKPFCTNLINRIKKGPGFFTEEFTQQEKKEFFIFLFEHEPWSKLDANQQRETLSSPGGYTRSCSVSKHTSIFIINHFGEKFSAEDNETLQRFAKVFEQAYTRFLDLQKAEAQTREAQIEAALERVRSRSMAMYNSEELKDVIQVVYEQFVKLNIKIEHAGFIIDYKQREDMHIWLADMYASPFEIAIPYFDSPHWNSFIKAKKEGQNFFANVLNFEEKNKFYQDLFQLIPPLPEEAQQTIFQKPGLAISTVLLDDVGLYIENFSGSPFNDEENITLMRFGKVFQQTYTRFLDLKKAEAQVIRAEQDLIVIKEARQNAEEALSELQTTQKQLIQSEKMASLGELTAGIAHEIQNPLNFVNNFSEVSNELIDEMNAEIEKGDLDEAKAIASDIKQNLEKINHHGKRADAIVKGMLQHSSSGSGKKEPTDINKLADEYLRLAYHGLIAKDKSFNSTLKTDYDESIGNINIIPQDIGRVVLNLITNAFYAATLPPPDSGFKNPEYKHEPTVWVSTKREGSKVFISVRDTGPGIPAEILDKIFQPFFTTKPTGQGTGLGLSMSYDIVKAHGGELKVETNEGEGTIFIIQLPINNA